MTLIDIIIEEVKQFRKDLINMLINRKLVDTGKSIESLKIESSNNNVKLLGVDYLEFLERGSRPWADKSLKSKRKLGYILKVSGWAARKGVNPYAVASVIVESGSQIFRNERAGIEVDNLVSDFKNRLNARITSFAKLEIERGLQKYAKQYQNSLN